MNIIPVKYTPVRQSKVTEIWVRVKAKGISISIEERGIIILKRIRHTLSIGSHSEKMDVKCLSLLIQKYIFNVIIQ